MFQFLFSSLLLIFLLFPFRIPFTQSYQIYHWFFKFSIPSLVLRHSDHPSNFLLHKKPRENSLPSLPSFLSPPSHKGRVLFSSTFSSTSWMQREQQQQRQENELEDIPPRVTVDFMDQEEDYQVYMTIYLPGKKTAAIHKELIKTILQVRKTALPLSSPLLSSVPLSLLLAMEREQCSSATTLFLD